MIFGTLARLNTRTRRRARLRAPALRVGLLLVFWAGSLFALGHDHGSSHDGEEHLCAACHFQHLELVPSEGDATASTGAPRDTVRNLGLKAVLPSPSPPAPPLRGPPELWL